MKSLPDTVDVNSNNAASSQDQAIDAHDAPIILDLGQRSKKQVKRLRRGDGKLIDRIGIVVEELKNSGKISPSAQPIVLIVRERREKGVAALFKS